MDDYYKIIIVDDEFFIRKGLQAFPWEKYGFIAIGTAVNGKQALELMEKEAADVVVTDIKMPIIDGIELSKALYEKYPACKIVILTGYEDFNYVKTAIRVGVFEYLLKPIDLNELSLVFNRLKAVLDEKKQGNKLMLSYEKQLKETLPFAVENFLKEILNQTIKGLDEIEEMMDLLEISAKKSFFVCAVYQFEQIQDDEIRKGMEAFFEKKNTHSFIFTNHSVITAIINFDTDDNIELPYQKIEKVIEESMVTLQSFFDKPLAYSIQISVGDVCRNILSLSNSYEQARVLLKKSFFKQGSQIAYIWQEDTNFNKNIPEYPYDIESQLVDSILEGNKEKSFIHLNRFLAEFYNSAIQVEPDYIKSIVKQLLNFLERRLNKYDTSLEQVMVVELPFTRLVEAQKTFHDLKGCVQEVILKVADFINTVNAKVKTSSHIAVNQVVQFIQDHYHEKISLNRAADHVYLNASYLSIQFKKEVGKNFIEYLKEFRMEKAKELLKRSDLKVYQISEKVGYQKQQYFTDSFKEFTGMTPMEYKQKTIF
ncbi:MAG: response regulator [Bacilli bacterium]|nr:response regulator [Bacilli bacterium]